VCANNKITHACIFRPLKHSCTCVNSYVFSDIHATVASSTLVTTSTASALGAAGAPPLPRIKSDSHMRSLQKHLGVESHDERGVHGGIPSTRPGMQESMVFLRKLFTHQHDGGNQMPTLFSPPDSPMRKSTLLAQVSCPGVVCGCLLSITAACLDVM
jgi:hypothetical protein